MFNALFSARLALAVLSISLLLPFTASATRLKDDNAYYLKHLSQNKYELDTSADAIVLYENTLLTVTYQEHRGLVITEDVRKIIKVLKKSGSSLADVSVVALHNDDYGSEIKKIRGYTYNLTNGKLDKHELDPHNIRESKSYNLITSKFSLPQVREGSVIEYSYTIERDFSRIFCSWEFQSHIPKLYSEVEVQVPGVCNVVSVSQNMAPFSDFADNKYDPYDPKLPLSYVDEKYTNGQEYLVKKWVRRNVPAAFDEPFTDNYRNYTENLVLQLTGFQERAFKWGAIDSWKLLNKMLYESSYYYGRLQSLNGNTKDKVKALVSGTTDSVQRAKNIYRYVRNYIKSENSSAFGLSKGLGEVFNDKQGTPSEVNFLLIAMLRHVGLEAYPLIIGSSEVLKPLEIIPVLERMDRTICVLKIDNKDIYLDASEPYTPFGFLPPGCYNGYSWMVAEKGKSVVLTPESVKEKELISVTGSVTSGNRMELEIKHYLGALQGAEYRREFHKDSATLYNGLVKESRNISGSAKVSRPEISGMNDPDTILVLHYFVSFTLPENPATFFFSPQFIRYFTENPFKSSVRNYPVEMPSAIDRSYVLQLQVPKEWELNEVPGSTTVELDDADQYRFMAEYNKEMNTLRVNSRLQMKRASFDKDEYDLLKAFFDKMMELEQANCVLKKSA